jgi:hypothetical protein
MMHHENRANQVWMEPAVTLETQDIGSEHHAGFATPSTRHVKCRMSIAAGVDCAETAPAHHRGT